MGGGLSVAEDLGERTEAPTSKRLSETRSRGQVAKSTNLSTSIDLIGAVVLLVVMGSWLVESMGALMKRILQPGADWGALDSARELLVLSAWEGLKGAVPFMLILASVAAIAHLVQTGFLFTLHPLAPKFDKLDPIKGIGRMLSLRSLAKLVVDMVKLAVVGALAWMVLGDKVKQIAGLPLLGAMQGAEMILRMCVELAIWLLVALLLIGVGDYLYQRWQHTRDLRMTKQEVKEEHKAMDGDPKIKSRRIKMAREIALQRARREVPTADVIVTNPTHYSVAIRYDATTMRAPTVVAKGVDHLAMRIRHLAIINGVPIVERPPLARALYYGVDEGREVPAEFYQAVAEILAYVYRLEQQSAA